MKQRAYVEISDTRVLSVRLPTKEAERMDELARTSGLTRNDYMRLCLKEGAAAVDAGKLDAIIELLRNLECLQEEHMAQLENIEAAALRNGWSETDMRGLDAYLQKGERLADELFKSQCKAVRAFEAIRMKVSR